MSKKRSPVHRAESYELIARHVHAAMIDARQLYDDHDYNAAYMLAVANWPLAVAMIFRRITSVVEATPMAVTNIAKQPPHSLIKRLANANRITPEQSADLHRCSVIVSLGWECSADARHLIDTATAMLELTESQGCKKRRAAMPQEAAAAPKRFSFPRWAAGIIGLAGASAS